MQLATVLPGEGPYQSAARILHEATGKRPDHKEVMALTRAIQRVYKAEHNGNGDMSGLRVRYQFITPQNFNMLLSEVQDEKTRQLLMGFAQQ
jgi:Lon protease-like protein